jgi:hypothetical protein
MLICATAVAAVGLKAAAQDVRLQHNLNQAFENSSEPGSADFWERFELAFEENVGDVFANRFNSLNVMHESLKLMDRNPQRLRDSNVNGATHSLSRSGFNSVREATVDLPVLSLLEERQGFLADFLRNSLGSVEEEAVAPLEVSYRPVERSWWDRLARAGDLCYGVQPFQTSPYAFLSMAVPDGYGLTILGHVRYHYRNLADHLFEFALSVPLAHRLALDLGTSYQFGRHDEEKRLVLKFFKGFQNGSLVHIGFELQRQPALFAGVVIGW